jgi:hypothetical protein
MTNENAIDTLECYFRENEDCQNMACELKSPQCKTDREVAIYMAVKALEKQIPKKPIERHYESEGEMQYIKITCPAGCRVQVTPRDKYCPICGQAIDWESEDNDD